jgi:hypothetical protein
VRKKFNSPIFVFSLISIFLLFFLAPIDTDLGWHLRYGEYFLKTGKFLTHNTLTYYLKNYYWPNSYSFYQIVIAVLYKFGGLFTLSIFYSLLGVLTFLVFEASYPKSTKINFVSFLAVVFFGWVVFKFGLRAQVFSFTFIILLNFILKKCSYNKGWFLIPLLFLFWVNLHGAFVLGFIFLASEGIRLLINKDKEKLTFLVLITFLSLLATLASPYGINIYSEVIRHIQTPMKTLIAEWVEPTILFKFFIAFITGILTIYVIKKDFKSKIHLIIPLFAFCYIGLSARRNLGLTALVFILIIYELALFRIEAFCLNKYITKIFPYIVLAIFVFSFKNISNTFSLTTNWDVFCKKGMLPYPCKAVNFIKKENIKGANVFSSYEWGGFLEWQLPDYKFFVDGRTPAWDTPESKSPYTVYLETIQAQPGYEEVLEKHQTDWLLLPVGTFLDIELQENKNIPWKEIYRDELSAIFIKR